MSAFQYSCHGSLNEKYNHFTNFSTTLVMNNIYCTESRKSINENEYLHGARDVFDLNIHTVKEIYGTCFNYVKYITGTVKIFSSHEYLLQIFQNTEKFISFFSFIVLKQLTVSFLIKLLPFLCLMYLFGSVLHMYLCLRLFLCLFLCLCELRQTLTIHKTL